MTTEQTVIRFNSDAYVCVHMLKHSDVVVMTSNFADETCAERYAQAIVDEGGHVFRTCKAGVLVAAMELIKTTLFSRDELEIHKLICERDA